MTTLALLRRRRKAGGGWFAAPSLALNGVLPSMVYQFANNRYYNSQDGVKSFPFPSTRTTNAMMFDSQGRLVWAPANMIPNSEMAGAGVGVAPTGWSLINTTGVTISTVGTGVDANGAYTEFSIIGTAGGSNEFPNITLNTSTSIDALNGEAFYAKTKLFRTATTPGTSLLFNILGRTAAGGIIAGQSWSQILTSSFGLIEPALSATMSDPTVGKIQIRYYFTVNAGQSINETVRFYKATQLEKLGPDSPKPYNPTTGSAWYGPRLDYDPRTLEPMGYLCEQAITNLITKSINLTGADITFTSATSVTSGSTHLGGWSASNCTGNGASATHVFYIGSFTPAASTMIALDAIIRPNSDTIFQLTGGGGWIVDGNCYVNFDCTGDGVITQAGASASNAFIRNLGNGVYHIGFSCMSKAVPVSGATTIVALITSPTDIRIPTNSSTASFDFIYSGTYVGTGFNLPVPTFGTAATKAADLPVETISAWFNQLRGTWYSSFIPGNNVTSARRIFSVSDGTVNNVYAMLRSTSSTLQIRSALAGVTDFSPSTLNFSTNFIENKAAIVLDSPSKKVVLNAGTVRTASVAFPTSGYTTFVAGAEVGGSAHLNGWLEEIRYYPDASASDPQLQTLTTP